MTQREFNKLLLDQMPELLEFDIDQMYDILEMAWQDYQMKPYEDYQESCNKCDPNDLAIQLELF